MRYVARVAGRTLTVELRENGHERLVMLEGRPLTLDWQRLGPEAAQSGDTTLAQHYSLLAEGHSYEAYARIVDVESAEGEIQGQGQAVEVTIAGRPLLVIIQDERSRALASLATGTHVAGDAAIRAPMPGLVSNVLAAVGDEVKRGQNMVVLEAMKMENDLTAPRAGIVKAVRVSKGQSVKQGEVLAVVGDVEGAAVPDDEDESG